MKKLVPFLFCSILCSLFLTSCGGGGEGSRQKYALSVNDFMAGRKFLLFSAPSCAFLIKPKDFSQEEIPHNDVLCPGEIYVYSESNSTDIKAIYQVPELRYAVDQDGNAVLNMSAIEPIVNSYWTAFCGALAGTGGELGGGSADSDYVKLSGVVITMNFSGDDKGVWESSCSANYAGEVSLRSGSGSLLLRPREYLFSK